MFVSHIKLKNWRNFRNVDVAMGDRVFLVGPNASGKSNFLDVFRFLRDIVKPGGGLQKAVSDRGGISKLLCLSARRDPEIEIEIHVSDNPDKCPLWEYSFGIKQESTGHHKLYLTHEKVIMGDKKVLERPDKDDKQDRLRLTQTHLEQINANAQFRVISDFFSTVLYFNLIPQLLQHPNDFPPAFDSSEDPFGRNFLKRIGDTPKNTRESRLKKIETALQMAVPQLTQLTYIIDAKEGISHLEAVYDHWRPHAGRQREDQFSDGTLRLIALLWSLLDSDSLLLFEEPELSLHTGIVNKLPSLMHRLLSKQRKKRQVILSTHSSELLSDKAIDGREVLVLSPGKEGTSVKSAYDITQIRTLLKTGMSVAEAVIPHIEPSNVRQLDLFNG
ncbi:MAG: AAA family ATPase [Candidatus Latescibacteria bacterium]|nr:AAA family ATPase [Candidatus Latescibacterota bacterium]